MVGDDAFRLTDRGSGIYFQDGGATGNAPTTQPPWKSLLLSTGEKNELIDKYLALRMCRRHSILSMEVFCLGCSGIMKSWALLKPV